MKCLHTQVWSGNHIQLAKKSLAAEKLDFHPIPNWQHSNFSSRRTILFEVGMLKKNKQHSADNLADISMNIKYCTKNNKMCVCVSWDFVRT